MPDKIVNHFVLADGSTAKYDAGALLNLDDTVSLAGYAPDAKAVGDRLTDVENLAETLNEGGLELKDEVIGKNVDDWMDTHPEASTTVLDDSLTTAKYKDGSVTTPKLADGAVTSAKVNADFLKEIKNAYVTPEQFGAVGDGVTDDTLAMKHAIESGKIVCGNGVYLVSGLNIVEGFLFHVHFLFKSSSTLVGKLTSLNSTFENCIFESTNDQNPSWGQGDGLFSNVHISTCNSSFYNCRFVKLEHVSIGNVGDTISSEYGHFNNCKWVDCASGITGNYSYNVAINNCTFELLTYTNLHCHAIYISNDCENWHISGCSFYGCKHYVFSISNNHTNGENPKDVFISDCVVDDAIEVINASADNVVFSNLELLDEMPEKFFMGGGKTTFYNSKIVGHTVFHVPDNSTFDNGETFYNKITLFSCSIKSDYEIICPQRNTTNVGTTNINSNNCVWECGVFSDSRSVNWTSNGDTLNITGSGFLFDNIDVASAPSSNSVFTVTFLNGSLNIENSAKITYGYGGNYSFENVSITGGSGVIFDTRSTDKSTMTISLNNVSFAVLGNWLVIGTSGKKHNIFNDNNYNNWKEIASYGRVSDIGTAEIDLDGYEKLRVAFMSGSSSVSGFVEFKNTDEQVRAVVFSSTDYYLSIKGIINNKKLTIANISSNGWNGQSFGLLVQGFRE